MRLGGCGVRLLRSLLSLKPKATRTSTVEGQIQIHTGFHEGPVQQGLQKISASNGARILDGIKYTSHLIDEYRKSSGKLVAVQSKSAKLSQRLKATAGS